MKRIGTIDVACRFLARPVDQFKKDEVINFIPYELATDSVALGILYWWLRLTKKNFSALKLKQSDSLHELYTEFNGLLEKYEVKDFDRNTENPYTIYCKRHSGAGVQMIEKFGEEVVCLNADLLEELVQVVVSYTFFNKYREKLPQTFRKAEGEMRELVGRYKLPGRYTWNVVVSRDKKEKRVVNFDFLNEFDNAVEP
ncbi:MAG: hypothetical protein JNM57_14690 [Cyclobacteriaceae bacterium]|nr:hypothetical protein [Cyclobacteriaceae bacterium]